MIDYSTFVIIVAASLAILSIFLFIQEAVMLTNAVKKIHYYSKELKETKDKLRESKAKEKSYMSIDALFKDTEKDASIEFLRKKQEELYLEIEQLKCENKRLRLIAEKRFSREDNVNEDKES